MTLRSDFRDSIPVLCKLVAVEDTGEMLQLISDTLDNRALAINLLIGTKCAVTALLKIAAKEAGFTDPAEIDELLAALMDGFIAAADEG